MARPASVYTPAEAAVVSGITIKAVNNALDKRILGERRPHGRRTLTGEDVLLSKVWHGVGSALPAKVRCALFDAIRADHSASKVRIGDLLIVDVAAARRQIRARDHDLAEAEAAVHRAAGVMGGQPVFRGTRIPIRFVAAMLQSGGDEPEILEGYPKLMARSLELSKIWVDAHPAQGRPKTLADDGARVMSVVSGPLPPDPLPRRSGIGVKFLVDECLHPSLVEIARPSFRGMARELARIEW